MCKGGKWDLWDLGLSEVSLLCRDFLARTERPELPDPRDLL